MIAYIIILFLVSSLIYFLIQNRKLKNEIKDNETIIQHLQSNPNDFTPLNPNGNNTNDDLTVRD